MNGLQLRVGNIDIGRPVDGQRRWSPPEMATTRRNCAVRKGNDNESAMRRDRLWQDPRLTKSPRPSGARESAIIRDDLCSKKHPSDRAQAAKALRAKALELLHAFKAGCFAVQTTRASGSATNTRPLEETATPRGRRRPPKLPDARQRLWPETPRWRASGDRLRYDAWPRTCRTQRPAHGGIQPHERGLVSRTVSPIACQPSKWRRASSTVDALRAA